jgi:hypothetical protein
MPIRNSRKRKMKAKLNIERLEAREIMSSTTITVSAPALVYGPSESTTLTATVTTTGGSAPSGTVAFDVNGAQVGTGTLSGSGNTATASFLYAPSAPLAVGAASVTASYAGDSNNDPSSTTPAFDLDVNYTPGDLAIMQVGSGSSIAITAVSASGNTATFTTGTTPHGLTVGQAVSISNVQAANCNGTFVVVSVIDPYSFRVVNNSSSANTSPGLTGIAGGSTSYNPSTGLVTVTTSAVNRYTIGENVSITGWSDPGLNGNFTITGTPVGTTGTNTIFTYQGPTGLSAPTMGSSGTALVANPALTSGTGSDAITAASEGGSNSNLVAITTANADGFIIGQTVQVAGIANTAYDGTFTIVGVPNAHTITYFAPAGLGASGSVASATVTVTTALNAQLGGLVNAATASLIVNYSNTSNALVPANTIALPSGGSVVTIASATETASPTNIVTVTNNGAQSFAAGQPVTIANDGPFNGTYTIIGGTIGGTNYSPTPTSFSFVAAQNLGVQAVKTATVSASGVVSITTVNAPGYITGQTVTISGIVDNGPSPHTAFDGTFTITGVISGGFTYTDSAAIGLTATVAGATTTVSAAGGSATVAAATTLTQNGTGAGTKSEGYITQSLNGQTDSFAGYYQPVGYGLNTNATGTPYVVGVLMPNGSVDTSTHFAAGDIAASVRSLAVRATVAADGLGFYVVTGNYTQYVPFGNQAGSAIGIATASVSGAIATFTTAVPHGFHVGDTVNTQGVQLTTTNAAASASGYNSGLGGFVVLSTPDPTTFTVALSGTIPTATGSGGFVTAQSSVQLQNFYNNSNAILLDSTGQLYLQNGNPSNAAQGIFASDSPAPIGTGAPVTGGQGGNPLLNFPSAADFQGAFPTPNQFAISPAGFAANPIIYMADGRTDTLGGLLRYVGITINGATTWALTGQVQIGTNVGIVSATEVGTNVIITTASPQNFTVGQQVTISGIGTTSGGFNGTQTITGILSPTQFEYTAVSGLGTGSPGPNGAHACDADSGLRGLQADWSVPGQVTLYGTTTLASGDRVIKIVDTNPGNLQNNNAGLGTPITLATAPVGTAYRGVALVPVAPGTSATTTTLAAPTTPVTYGTEMALTATVTGSATGVVSFRTGSPAGAEIGFAVLSGGTATLNMVGNLPASATPYTVYAVYTGDATHAPSASSGQSITVQQQAATVSLTSPTSSVGTGSAYTLAAQVTVVPTATYDPISHTFYSTGVQPTGMVSFYNGSVSQANLLGVAPVVQNITNTGYQGTAQITFTASLTATAQATPGTPTIIAVYSGDTNFSTTQGSGQIAFGASTTNIVTTNTPNAAYNTGAVTFTATLASTTAGTITGTVQFYDNLLPIGSPVSVSGPNTGATVTQIISTSLVQAAGVIGIGAGNSADTLTPGLHSITAVYSGNLSSGNATYVPSTGVYEQAVSGLPMNVADIFVARVGDGTTPLLATTGSPFAGTASNGSTIFVDEMTSDGIAGLTKNGGGTVTVDFATPTARTLAVGQSLGIAGASNADFNGTFAITQVNSPTEALVAASPAETSATATTATYVLQSFILPSYAGTGSQNTIHAIVGDGQQSLVGQLTLSGDGQYLFLTGYDSSRNGDPANNAAAPKLGASFSTPRAAARIAYNGTITTEGFTTSGNSAVNPSGNIVGVYSPDGNQLYISGANGVIYLPSWAPSSTLIATGVPISSGATTGLQAQGASLDAVNFPYGAVNLVGTYGSFPTAATPLATLPGLPAGAQTTRPLDVYFTHLDGTSAPAGINTMYISEYGPSFAGPSNFIDGAITKYALVNGSWVQANGGVGNIVTAGTGNSATDFRWLAGSTSSSGTVTLYSTYGQGGNQPAYPPPEWGEFYSVTDSNGWNQPIGTGGTASSAVNTLYVVGPNDGVYPADVNQQLYRGVALAPQAMTNTLVGNGPNPSLYGSTSASLAVTIASPGSINVPTGAVTLKDASNGNAVVATGTLSSGSYTFNLSSTALLAGAHDLFVAYGGDTYHQSQKSNSVTQTVTAGPFSKFVVTSPTGNTLTAGTPFLVTIQATDAGGNPITNYTGPTSVTVAASPVDPQSSFPITSTLNGSGLAFFMGDFNKAGVYTLTATAGTFSGSSANLTVAPSAPSYFTVAAPATAGTGSPVNVTVTAYDHFGNIATGYTGTVKLTSTDPAVNLGNYTFTSGTGKDNGIHTFGVTLKTAGSQTITATDTASTNPTVTGTSSPITTRGLTVTGLTPTATGFTVNFSEPFTVTDVNLYGGSQTSPLQDVTLVGASSGPVNGSFVVDPSGTSATFKASSIFLSTFFQSTVLPDDTWTVTLTSGTGTGATAHGFFDASNVPLDGSNNAGHDNYTTTFTTANSSKEALSIPDFARGPDSANSIKVPNDSAQGIPVTLASVPAVSGVTDAIFTLTYNPTLLTPTGAGTGDASGTASTFTMGAPVSIDATHSTVTFTWHNAAAQSGTVLLGDLLANVPDSAASEYKGKEILALSDIKVNGSDFTGVWANGLHVNTYFGDVTGDGKISGLDVATAGAVASGNSLGLPAYKLVDPAVLGDIAGDASVDATAVSDLASFTAKLPAPQIPAIPSNVTITPGGPDPTLSLAPEGMKDEGGRMNQTNDPTHPSSFNLQPSVSVLLDDPHPAGSTGMEEAVLALTYDPKVLTVSASDITLGSIPGSGSGWHLVSVVDQATGQIGIDLYSTTPITAMQAGSLVNIVFHVAPGAAASATSLQLVSAVTPNGQPFRTEVADDQGQYVLSPGTDRLTVWPYQFAAPASFATSAAARKPMLRSRMVGT